MIPVGEEVGLQQYVAECVIFGSGRPTIVLPETPKIRRPLSLDVVGVAWDFSRPAARAIADAMPILERAKTVRVVTVTQEKGIDTKRSGAELMRHLAFHGIETVVEEEEAAGRSIGQALEDYTIAHDFDLLVMGAYGHSRLRDFVLGGATKAVIAHPPLPVLLSH
jgi:nucleotide-binding universal stress UspA family protein